MYFSSRSDLENSKFYEFDHSVSAGEIGRFFREHPTNELCLFEYGIDDVRLDLVKIRPVRGYMDVVIRAFEIKVSRADFLSDKKWEKYLSYCNSLTFVCPVGVIDKGELPKEVGLLYVFKYRRRGSDREPSLGAVWARRARRHDLHHVRKKRMIISMLFKAKYRMGEIF